MFSTLFLLTLLTNQLINLQASLPPHDTRVAYAQERAIASTTEPHIPIPQSNEERALSLITKYSKQYNVSAKDMERVMRCENRSFNPTLQSGYYYKTGGRERSYGLSQIHLPAHTDITYAQATNAEFSVEFMAKEFSKGNQKIWSCWSPLQKG